MIPPLDGWFKSRGCVWAPEWGVQDRDTLLWRGSVPFSPPQWGCEEPGERSDGTDWWTEDRQTGGCGADMQGACCGTTALGSDQKACEDSPDIALKRNSLVIMGGTVMPLKDICFCGLGQTFDVCFQHAFLLLWFLIYSRVLWWRN